MRTRIRFSTPVLSFLSFLTFWPQFSAHSQSGSGLYVYDEALLAPWENSSWSAAVTFNSTEEASGGTTSIKVALTSAWGALSIHHGNWGSAGFQSGGYRSLDFMVHGGATGVQLSVFFENDAGESFPKVQSSPLPADQWTSVSFPLTGLNPDNQVVHRISIQEVSGSARTFYVDDLLFAASGIVPASPVPASPASGSSNMSRNPTLEWNVASGAASYWLQVSTSLDFDFLVHDQENISTTSLAVGTLAHESEFYWRVSGSNVNGSSGWSDVWSFSTEPIPPSGWAGQTSATTAHLHAVSFVDANTGTVVGVKGVILRTTDGGSIWIRQNGGTSTTLLGVSFSDVNTGTAVGYSGTILRTTDGGETWVSQTSGTNEHLYGVTFLDAERGIAVGYSRTILMTANGGATWQTSYSGGGNSGFHGASFVNENVIYVVGGDNTILKSTDGGLSWAGLQSGTSTILDAVCFIDALTGTIVGGDGTIIRTTDGGETWVSQSSGVSGPLYDVSFADVNNGVAVGGYGGILRTTNGGSSWMNESITMTIGTLTGVCYQAPGVGTVVGGGGTILRAPDIAAPPSPPTLVGPANGATAVATSPLLEWNTPESADFYGLQLSTDPQFSQGIVSHGAINVAYFQASGLLFETTYYWRVRSWVGSAYTSWSEVGSFTTMPASQSPWSVQSSGTSTRLWDADFIGPNVVLAVGDAGTILRSSDGGVTWTSQTSGTSAHLRALSFVDVNTGTVVGSGGTILRTFDGGTTWISQSGVSTDLVGASFTDANTGKIVASSAQLYGTTDGGSNWIYMTNVATSFAGALHFTDATSGHVLGFFSGAGTGGGGVLRTADGGSSWSPTIAGSRSGMSDLSFAGARGMTVGMDENRPAGSPSYNYAVLWKTDNGGSSWSEQNFFNRQYRYRLSGVSVADSINSAIVGEAGAVFVSRNGGPREIQSTGTSSTLRGVAMQGGSTIIAVGDGGLILRSSAVGPPNPPALVSPPDGRTETISYWGNVSLYWNESIGAESYRIQLSTDSGFTNPLDEAGVTQNYYDFSTQMRSPSTIYWRVQAANSIGSSGWSEVWSFAFRWAAPVAPTLSSPANGAVNISTTPNLSWEHPPAGERIAHHVQVSTDSSFAPLAYEQDDISYTQNSVPVEGLREATTYLWRVRAKGSGGTSNWSDVWSFTTEGPQSVPDLIVYDESLFSPWLNASWGGSVTFNSTDQSYTGINAIKVAPAGSWGALSLHHGNWGSGGIVDPDVYESIDVAVYSSDAASIHISLANDQGQSFPSQSRSIPADEWTPVSLAMSQVNPNGQTIHRLSIQKSTAGVWYVDDISFAGGQASQASRTTALVKTRPTPKEFALRQNYPNPFNPSTTFQYELAVGAYVVITVHDLLGRQVGSIFAGRKEAGYYTESFDARGLSSGIYVYRIQADGVDGKTIASSKRMILMK